ncbi:hypothetical protein EYZ11_001324 [Aspergillus tanneri]|uniref:Mucin family signaling protein Msb2 n=1 Tax=Aspergillus tanneri TaxID=1220188 RepID=A0A4S3JV05_9EURO|nr:uncharacterized protein ATNIH1004_002777 [Aspergillus tanneri]KAA8650096.1 hypothetical protein ATNIH1004_002777 [Aspergillus tanneri]THC99236.1 hypothetical protein EYZ11_001324 [Aspergillus tanneri]
MIPPTSAVLTAFLSLGGLELVAARDAAVEQALKPRFIPKYLKRQINYTPSFTPSSGPGTSDVASGRDAGTTPPAPGPPVVVIPVTISVDRNGVTHTITGALPTGTSGAVTSISSTSISEQPVSPPPASNPVVAAQSSNKDVTSQPTKNTESDTSASNSGSAPPVSSHGATPGDAGNTLGSSSGKAVSGTPIPALPVAPVNPTSDAILENPKQTGSTTSIPVIGSGTASSTLLPSSEGSSSGGSESTSVRIIDHSSTQSIPLPSPQPEDPYPSGQSESSTVPIIGLSRTKSTPQPTKTSDDTTTRSIPASNSREGSSSPTSSSDLIGIILSPSGTAEPTTSDSSRADPTGSSGILPTIAVSVPLMPSLSNGPKVTPPFISPQPLPSDSSGPIVPIPGGSATTDLTGSYTGTGSLTITGSTTATGSHNGTASETATGSPGSKSTLGSSGAHGTSSSTRTSGAVIPTGTRSGSAGLSSTAVSSTKTSPSKATNPTNPNSTSAHVPSTEPPEQSSTATSNTEPTPTPEPSPEPTPKASSSSSGSDDWVPSTILVEPPTPTTQDSATHETATATSTSTQLPGAISPPGEIKTPKDAIMIRLGFNEKLRYSFVATTTLSSSQIFLYVPKGLMYAMGLSSDQVSMVTIQPLQTHGYLATTVLAYVSKTDYLWNGNSSQFEQDMWNPNSRVYEQPNESVKTLFSMLDPSIDLWPNGKPGSDGGGSNGNGQNSGGSGSGGDGKGNNSGGNGDGGASSSSTARPSSVGIGLGVVAGAAAYGAGMFWVARRYRKKRQLHRRSTSNVEQLSGAGTAFATGGRISRNSQVSRGGSARTQMISAPVMAENSLGWN